LLQVGTISAYRANSLEFPKRSQRNCSWRRRATRNITHDSLPEQQTSLSLERLCLVVLRGTSVLSLVKHGRNAGNPHPWLRLAESSRALGTHVSTLAQPGWHLAIRSSGAAPACGLRGRLSSTVGRHKTLVSHSHHLGEASMSYSKYVDWPTSALLSLSVFLSSCTTLSFVPQAGLTPIPESDCRFVVDDQRPNPTVILSRRRTGNYGVGLSTPLAQAMRFHVCNGLRPEQRQISAHFSIVGFECLEEAGLFSATTFALMRGHLSVGNRQKVEVRSQAPDGGGSVLWRTSCEDAAKNVFDRVIRQIGPALEAPAKPTGSPSA